MFFFFSCLFVLDKATSIMFKISGAVRHLFSDLRERVVSLLPISEMLVVGFLHILYQDGQVFFYSYFADNFIKNECCTLSNVFPDSKLIIWLLFFFGLLTYYIEWFFSVKSTLFSQDKSHCPTCIMIFIWLAKILL